jgi:hypothetical protein
MPQAAAPTAGAVRSQPDRRDCVQHVGRIDRQERGRTTKQHREEIERDRTEHHAVAPHELEPEQQGLEACGLARPVADAARTQREREPHGDREQRRGARVDHWRAGQVDDAPQRRSRNRRDLPGRGIDRDRSTELLPGNEVRQQCLSGRHLEGTRDSEQGHDRKDRCRLGQPAKHDREQEQRTDAFERITGRHDSAAIPAVGKMPGRQDRQDKGQELRQADQTEVERIARDFVYLPADRDVCICTASVPRNRATRYRLKSRLPKTASRFAPRALIPLRSVAVVAGRKRRIAPQCVHDDGGARLDLAQP